MNATSCCFSGFEFAAAAAAAEAAAECPIPDEGHTCQLGSSYLLDERANYALLIAQSAAQAGRDSLAPRQRY